MFTEPIELESNVFHLACGRGNLPAVKAYLEENPDFDINKKSLSQNTPLHRAVYFQQEEVVRYLLQNYASELDLNLMNDVGNTPLHVACMFSYYNYDWVPTRTNLSYSSSSASRQSNRSNRSKYSVKSTASETGSQKLHQAKLQIVKLLLKYGARTSLKNKRQLTVCDVALIFEQDDILEVIDAHLNGEEKKTSIQYPVHILLSNDDLNNHNHNNNSNSNSNPLIEPVNSPSPNLPSMSSPTLSNLSLSPNPSSRNPLNHMRSNRRGSIANLESVTVEQNPGRRTTMMSDFRRKKKSFLSALSLSPSQTSMVTETSSLPILHQNSVESLGTSSTNSLSLGMKKQNRLSKKQNRETKSGILRLQVMVQHKHIVLDFFPSQHVKDVILKAFKALSVSNMDITKVVFSDVCGREYDIFSNVNLATFFKGDHIVFIDW